MGHLSIFHSDHRRLTQHPVVDQRCGSRAFCARSTKRWQPGNVSQRRPEAKPLWRTCFWAGPSGIGDGDPDGLNRIYPGSGDYYWGYMGK
jgi:hypothetical protein